MMMGVVVIPGHLYNNSRDITPSDTVNNLLSGDMSFAYIQNTNATAVTAIIKTRTSSTDMTVRLEAGASWRLPPQALRVMATGTTGGAGQTGLKGYF